MPRSVIPNIAVGHRSPHHDERIGLASLSGRPRLGRSTFAWHCYLYWPNGSHLSLPTELRLKDARGAFLGLLVVLIVVLIVGDPGRIDRQAGRPARDPRSY
jgi:hypothetical protein